MTVVKVWKSILVVSVLLCASAALGQEWTRFRGPAGQGVGIAKNIPAKFTEKDYNWKIKLPGAGHSSPVVWGDTVFVTSGDGEAQKGYVVAINTADGNERWREEIDLAQYAMNERNSYATGSPSVDAKRVYSIWPSEVETFVVALDHKGGLAWRKEFPGVHASHGPGNSIVVVGDLVVFSHEQQEGSKERGAWYALDAATGDARWKLDRENSPKHVSYSTPAIYTPEGGEPQLIFNSYLHGITAVDPKCGEILWSAPKALQKRVVSSPVVAGDLLLGSCGSGSAGMRLVAVRAGGKGGAPPAAEAYELKGPFAAYVPTSLYKDGLVFTFHDRGNAGCFEAATGKELWNEKPAGPAYGSPVWVDGKIYCITIAGEVVVLEASRSYNLLAVNPLGEQSHATPAAAGNKMYLRTLTHLISIGGK